MLACRHQFHSKKARTNLVAKNIYTSIVSNAHTYHQIGYLTIVQRVICVYNDAIVRNLLKA